MDRIITATEHGGSVMQLWNPENCAPASAFIEDQQCKKSPTQVTQDALELRTREESTHTLIITFTITGEKHIFPKALAVFLLMTDTRAS